MQLADFFETNGTKYNGTLYLGYPVIGTAEGGFKIDAMLVTQEHCVIAFHLVEGPTIEGLDYQSIQDDVYNKIFSKLFQYSELTNKKSPVFKIEVVTFAPALTDKTESNPEYPLFSNIEKIQTFLDENDTKWDKSEYFEQLQSVIQSITNIRKQKSRGYVKQVDSRGAKLKKLEDSIANLDKKQSSAVIETVEGVQRIRGLAGSGKTIILALKVAYLHALNPEWKIAVTFNTRSLKSQFKKFIRMFSYEHTNEEPNWDNLSVIHAWGSVHEEGIYFNLTKEHNIEYYDYKLAKAIAPGYGYEFETVCKKALHEISSFQEKYDLIVVDEAQDFSDEFLKICYNILRNPKRLIYAYDELQSLNSRGMNSPEVIFGNDSNGRPLVSLQNQRGKPLEDIILYKCYRNPMEILSTAHALGFGIYRETGLVQMFEHSGLWNDIGYEVVSGNLIDGQNVTLSRTNETSPEFLSNHSEIDDILSFKNFEDNESQINFIVESIIKNINEDELKLDDIIVINPDPLTTKNVVGAFREKLFKEGINSNLAGVSTSPDIFYTDEAITFTGIFRAKGNEAAMVYIINAQYCFDGIELAKKRNILFTAMTRSKAWLRVCGYGPGMDGLNNEFMKIKNNNFQLQFTYPNEQERKKMNTLNKDISNEEKRAINSATRSIERAIDNLSQVDLDLLPPEILEELKNRLSH